MRELREESQIISAWGKVERPLVSVISTTYNHDKYIEDALQGFLIQETNFPFEVIIHDDASTDSTPMIIRKYAEKYPNIIKPILQNKNQYSQGKKCIFIAAKHAKGQYLALCEGDDYWTDKNKLKLQILGLEKNPKCKLSFHSAIKHNLKTGEKSTIGRYRRNDGIVRASDIIKKTVGMIPTASCLIHKDAFAICKDFITQNTYLPIGDVFIQAIAASFFGGFFIDKNMSFYRFLGPGSWTSISTKPENYFSFVKNRIRGFNELCKYLDYSYKNDIKVTNQNFAMDFIKSDSIVNEKKQILKIGLTFFKINHFIIAYMIVYVPGFFLIYKIANRFRNYFFRKFKIKTIFGIFIFTLHLIEK